VEEEMVGAGTPRVLGIASKHIYTAKAREGFINLIRYAPASDRNALRYTQTGPDDSGVIAGGSLFDIQLSNCDFRNSSAGENSQSSMSTDSTAGVEVHLGTDALDQVSGG
jgi:hypothetical protein